MALLMKNFHCNVFLSRGVGGDVRVLCLELCSVESMEFIVNYELRESVHWHVE